MSGNGDTGRCPGSARRLVLRTGGALALAGTLPLALPRAQALAPARPLKVISFALAPFGMLDAAGMPAGVTVDMQKLLAQESGLAMDIAIVPYPRAVAMMVSGEADLVFSLPNPQLLAHARSLGGIASVDIVAIGRAGSRYASVADLRGKTLGHIRGAMYDDALQSDPAVRLHETTTYEQALRMLLEGRFDAALGVRLCLLESLRLLGVARTRLGPALEISRRQMQVHYANKRYDPQVAATLSRALAALRQRDTGAALLKPYEDLVAQAPR